MPKDNSGQKLPFARSFAFIIGINDYEKHGDAPSLQTALNDTRALAEILRKNPHDYEVTFLENATGKQLVELLEETIPAAQLGKRDRVLFYFAGHGVADDGDGRPEGYLLPVDAQLDDISSFFPMKTLHDQLSVLDCAHMLLILDCCFSGAFRWASKDRAAGVPPPRRISQYRFQRFCEDEASQVITSASYYQKAQDVSNLKARALGKRDEVIAAATQDSNIHSPFAQALLEGLGGLADTRISERGDGVITSKELYNYIGDRLAEMSDPGSNKESQKPNYIELDDHGGGEYIFLHPRHPLNLPPTPNRNPFKGLASYDESDRDLFFGRGQAISELEQKSAMNRLVVVSGISGSGKSSVVKAGLLPRLTGARLSNSARGAAGLSAAAIAGKKDQHLAGLST